MNPSKMKKTTCSRASPSGNRQANARTEIPSYPPLGDILKKWGVTNSCPVIQGIVRRINLRNEPSCFHPVGLFNLFLWLGFFFSLFYFIFRFFSSRVMDANAQLWFNDREKIFFFFFSELTPPRIKSCIFIWTFSSWSFGWNFLGTCTSEIWNFLGVESYAVYIYIARFKGCYLELYFL